MNLYKIINEEHGAVYTNDLSSAKLVLDWAFKDDGEIISFQDVHEDELPTTALSLLDKVCDFCGCSFADELPIPAKVYLKRSTYESA